MAQVTIAAAFPVCRLAGRRARDFGRRDAAFTVSLKLNAGWLMACWAGGCGAKFCAAIPILGKLDRCSAMACSKTSGRAWGLRLAAAFVHISIACALLVGRAGGRTLGPVVGYTYAADFGLADRAHTIACYGVLHAAFGAVIFTDAIAVFKHMQQVFACLALQGYGAISPGADFPLIKRCIADDGPFLCALPFTAAEYFFGRFGYVGAVKYRGARNAGGAAPALAGRALAKTAGG